jgi:exopolyphosphatase/guanosine-5'-triphosphate,3'-diphosphate pyrophosphatase
LNVRILTGEEEAAAAGYGVLSALPGADGIVADLGGGSLELVRVYGGAVHDRVSLPLGILKVPDIRALGPGKLTRHVKALADSIDWVKGCRRLPLYLVGGSWRSLARIHMMQVNFPLTVLGNYSLAPDDARPLSDYVAQMAKAEIKAVPAMPSSRVPMVADAAALLATLTEAVSPSTLMICPFGLREGLLFQTLTNAEQRLDPLIEGVRFFAKTQQQIDGYGDSLMSWMDGVFNGEPAELRRLRHAACLLHGTGWASNPDFRAIGGEELALHGNWAGVSPCDRAIMGMALFIGMGGSAAEEPGILRQLTDEPSLNRARQWGLAMRLAQRLSGGASSILQHCRIERDAAVLRLTLPVDYTALDEPPLRKRLAALAAAFNMEWNINNSGASLSPSPVE